MIRRRRLPRFISSRAMESLKNYETMQSNNPDIEERYLPGYMKDFMDVLKSSGRSRPVGDFPVLETYIKEAGSYPNMKNYGEIYLNHEEFMKEFRDLIKQTYFSKETIKEDTYEPMVEYGVYGLGKGYIAEISVGYQTIDNFSVSVQSLLREISKKDNVAATSNLLLYLPNQDSPLYNEETERIVLEIVKKYKLEKNTTTPCIGMICYEDGDFYTKTFYIKKDYTIKNGDLHYGEGFTSFHDQLVERFKSDPKGLVLLHGLPGTGKTFYIRSLIKDLISIGKYVIYLPPSMIEQMVDPTMINFISTLVMEKAEEGKSCVLLLEDAEPLLVSRKTENRSGGITNLLNVTDGLLNDMLNIQVIATFNTELSNIDEALLRPERLIARKEFKALKKEDAQILADTLGIEKKIDKASTLAEIYSQSKHSEILVHEYVSDSRKIGFGN